MRSYLHYFLLENRLEIVAILDRIIQTVTQPSATNNEVDADAAAANTGAAADPFLVSQLTALLPPAIKDTVQRATLRFIRQHANHLPAYVIPTPFYPGPQAKPRTNA